MAEEDDIDGLAAEYVLGSLDAAKRQQVDARRRTDASVIAAIVAWERRLAPLNDRVEKASRRQSIYSTASWRGSRAWQRNTGVATWCRWANAPRLRPSVGGARDRSQRASGKPITGNWMVELPAADLASARQNGLRQTV